MRLTILADDLTGASDAGLQFARRGASTTLRLDAGGEAPETDVLVCDLDTRTCRPDEAEAQVAHGLRDVACDGRLVMKIDSTLRGNIAAQVRALLKTLPEAIALVVPAYPAHGRIQRDGMVLVNGRPVTETDFGLDLFSPARSNETASHLPDGARASIDHMTVADGADALAAVVEQRVRDGARAIAIDALDDDQLVTIAAVAKRDRRYVVVGSAGIIRLLAEEFGAATDAAAAAPADGPLLYLVGSVSPMTRSQVQTAARRGTFVEHVDSRSLLTEDDGFGATLRKRVGAQLADGRDAIVALSSDRSVVERALDHGRARGLDAAATGARLRRTFVSLVAPLTAQAGIVLVSGADVARTYCEAAEIRALRIGAEIVPGVAISHAVGSGARVILKGGSFGAPETYCDIARALRAPVTSSPPA